ncbi:hypothetical protein G6F46_007611 [Rhizopus delemar]|uniref:ENTH domain-containing protein n=2 Tax=Rhizopus TaxID=4842 RepID=A0A9P6Z5T5_9FUNG|nr:hypothetical protein G6F43_005811 [Rhizopus delemar]KAG1541535.1 hypothetical protein G6F51_007835 [Rhizopus arrhizus]KAG1456445.1 hypothetical protein G6F55_006499 [Rhizopus delemar]KAG1499541.1 hypothetical protein G6F54_004340 [Rhizopus delemar]KAG1515687.1 hypothetical protein G6F53_002726 [Rhizopus delemar]
MQTAVRKSTRLEYKPPKIKHLTTLKNITVENPQNIQEILIALEKRLKEGYWIITFKVFIVLHYLIREGNHKLVMEAIDRHRPQILDLSCQSQIDHSAQGIMRRLSLSDGLFEETRRLQQLLESALYCKFRLNEGNPSIALFAYQLVILDILSLFQAINEAIINILEHYFEMPVMNAKEALEIYKVFAKQTQSVIEFLEAARMYEGSLQMRLPPINHAPVSLVDSLEEYLEDLNASKKEINQQSVSVAEVNQQPLFVTTEPLLFQQERQSFNPFTTPSLSQPMNSYNSNPFSPTHMTYDTNPFRAMRQGYQNPFSPK